MSTKQEVKKAPPIQNPLGPHKDLIVIDIKQFDENKAKKEEGKSKTEG